MKILVTILHQTIYKGPLKLFKYEFSKFPTSNIPQGETRSKLKTLVSFGNQNPFLTDFPHSCRELMFGNYKSPKIWACGNPLFLGFSSLTSSYDLQILFCIILHRHQTCPISALVVSCATYPNYNFSGIRKSTREKVRHHLAGCNSFFVLDEWMQ